jgi:EAL domain-containing protein (putative c-di-GMP-specific phosphodiesterase class I)
MSINMSVRNLQDIQFPERVAKVMETMCKNTDKLWLEITETAIMSDPERSRDILASLNDMHVKLSIDDFGTGYSSLAYLKQLPVREIKIDKSFVMGMADSENDAVIVRSIIDLAHNIGLVVIAEGVEDERSYHTLEKLGCDLAQGYFISRPVPVKEFDAWLGDSRWGLFSGKPHA